MIAFLRGQVLRRATDAVILDVDGVGYEVFCTVRTAARLVVGHEVELHIHTGVTDDAIRLYGFEKVDELRLFRLLIGVERIGPKAALAILGRAELNVIAKAISAGDAALLATVPGIGRKTAERLVLELSGKLDWLGPAPISIALATEHVATTAREEAVAALVGLGFRDSQARDAVASTEPDEKDTATVVAAALRVLDSVPAR
jgi:holliday junction DNA helicase RuvA